WDVSRQPVLQGQRRGGGLDPGGRPDHGGRRRLLRHRAERGGEPRGLPGPPRMACRGGRGMSTASPPHDGSPEGTVDKEREGLARRANDARTVTRIQRSRGWPALEPAAL